MSMEEEQGEVFLVVSDIIYEIDVDEEDLPDADGDEIESLEEADDSFHLFTRHKVACSPTDPILVATGGGDDKRFLWKMGHDDWASELQGHTDSVNSLAFSSDGQLLVSGSLDGLVKIWDMSGNLKRTLDGPEGGIEGAPKVYLVLAGCEDRAVWMRDADNGDCLNVFSGHGASVTCGDFTPDGKTICTGSEDATMRIWNPESGESIHVVRGHPCHTEGLTCLSISSDSTLAVTGSKDGSVYIVNITTGKEGVTCLAWFKHLNSWPRGVVMGNYAYGIVSLGNVWKP